MKQNYARTKPKSMCISICGVLLWNGIEGKNKTEYKYIAIQEKCVKNVSLKGTVGKKKSVTLASFFS